MDAMYMRGDNGRNAPPPMEKGDFAFPSDATPGETLRTEEDIADVFHVLSMAVSPTAPHFLRFLRGGLN